MACGFSLSWLCEKVFPSTKSVKIEKVENVERVSSSNLVVGFLYEYHPSMTSFDLRKVSLIQKRVGRVVLIVNSSSTNICHSQV